MSDDRLLDESAEDLFENAPCGYVSTRLDGMIVRVNRTFESLTGLARDDLIDAKRFQDLLSPGGRIYHETHYAPLLRMQGSVSEIAVEVVRADGSRLPVLLNSVVRHDEDGRPYGIRTTVFDASDRRRYEEELLRARRREQETARELQRSLLSGDLPATAAIEVGVSYRPAVRGLEVGGDWYDAFWLEDGESVALVVGDVVGRGIEAAATMGQLRSAVRTLASTGLEPGPLLDALDAYVLRHSVGETATVVYASLRLDSGELVVACAGHPPPAIVAGDAALLEWEGRSPPLATPLRSGGRAQVSLSLPVGGAVVLYTDGLVEQRSRSLDEGLDRLLEAVVARRADPAGAMANGVMRALQDPEHMDDMCILVARRTA